MQHVTLQPSSPFPLHAMALPSPLPHRFVQPRLPDPSAAPRASSSHGLDSGRAHAEHQLPGQAVFTSICARAQGTSMDQVQWCAIRFILKGASFQRSGRRGRRRARNKDIVDANRQLQIKALHCAFGARRVCVGQRLHLGCFPPNFARANALRMGISCHQQPAETSTTTLHPARANGCKTKRQFVKLKGQSWRAFKIEELLRTLR